MASTSSNVNWSNVQVPIFSGENYDFWSIKMKTLFVSIDLWEMVESGYEIPESTSSLTNAQKKELKENRSKDAGALGMIQRGVSETIFPRIMGATRAKEAWDTLQEEFQGDKKVRAIKLQTLRRDFENMRMKENESVKDYSTRFLELVNQMKAYGEDMADRRIVEKILISLHEKFDPMVAVIEETKDLSSLGVQELLGSLKSHEQRLERHSEKSIESAFQSKLTVNSKNSEKRVLTHEQGEGDSTRGGRSFRARGRGRSPRGRGRGSFERKPSVEGSSQRCNICKKSSHVEKDCWFKGKPQCFNCKKFGHLQRDCRFLKNNQQANFSEEKESEGNLFYACQHVSEKKNNIWFLDSGCSNHMTPEKEIFLDIDTSFHSKVKMGNGAVVDVKGKGNVGVETKRGLKKIREVLFVPELDQNLLSIGQLMEHDYALHFEGRTCTIYDEGREKLVVAEVKMAPNRSFPLTFKYAKDMALKASLLDESWLWHRRFGHLNFQSLKLLHQKNMVQGLPIISEKNEVCEGCALGKHHRQPFSKGVA
jgi:hypothetical protein